MQRNLVFWAVGIFGILWSGMGLLDLGMQQHPANLAQMPPLFQAIVAARPMWAKIAFGLAVNC